MWQEILTVLILGGAVFYLVRRFFFADKSKSGCGSCASGEIVKKSEKRA